MEVISSGLSRIKLDETRCCYPGYDAIFLYTNFGFSLNVVISSDVCFLCIDNPNMDLDRCHHTFFYLPFVWACSRAGSILGILGGDFRSTLYFVENLVAHKDAYIE